MEFPVKVSKSEYKRMKDQFSLEELIWLQNNGQLIIKEEKQQRRVIEIKEYDETKEFVAERRERRKFIRSNGKKGKRENVVKAYNVEITKNKDASK